MKKMLLAGFAILFVMANAWSQKLELEKTHELSGKAKRGYLGKINMLIR